MLWWKDVYHLGHIYTWSLIQLFEIKYACSLTKGGGIYKRSKVFSLFLFIMLLSKGLKKLGLSDSPIHDPRIHIEKKERIGYITLRLAPPIHIKSLQDALYVLLNHEFLRLVVVAAWLVVCGFIESFLAQLSDIRYFYTSDTLKVSTPTQIMV